MPFFVKIFLLKYSWLIGKDLDARKDWRQNEKKGAEGEIDSLTDSMDMNLGKLQEIERNKEAGHAAVHGVAKSWTQLNDWTELNSLVAQLVKNLPALQETPIWFLDQEDSLEKG